MTNEKRKGEKGIALTSVLLSMCLIGTILSYAFQVLEIERKNGISQRSKYDYLNIKSLAHTLAESRFLLTEAIMNTDLNHELRDCMLDESAIGLPDYVCDSTKIHSVQYGIHEKNVNWLPLSNSNDSLYNRYGQLCVTHIEHLTLPILPTGILSNDNTCRKQTFQLEVNFKAVCAGGAAFCKLASSLIVNVTIKPSSDLNFNTYTATHKIDLYTSSKDTTVKLTKASAPKPTPKLASTTSLTKSTAPKSTTTTSSTTTSVAKTIVVGTKVVVAEGTKPVSSGSTTTTTSTTKTSGSTTSLTSGTSGSTTTVTSGPTTVGGSSSTVGGGPPPPPPPPPVFDSCGSGMAGNTSGGCSAFVL